MVDCVCAMYCSAGRLAQPKTEGIDKQLPATIYVPLLPPPLLTIKIRHLPTQLYDSSQSRSLFCMLQASYQLATGPVLRRRLGCQRQAVRINTSLQLTSCRLHDVNYFCLSVLPTTWDRRYVAKLYPFIWCCFDPGFPFPGTFCMCSSLVFTSFLAQLLFCQLPDLSQHHFQCLCLVLEALNLRAALCARHDWGTVSSSPYRTGAQLTRRRPHRRHTSLVCGVCVHRHIRGLEGVRHVDG